MLASHGGDADLRSYSSLGNRDRDDAMEVIAFAREEGMIFHMKNEVEVAGRPAKLTDLSHPRKTDAGSILDPCGNLRVNGILAQDSAFTLALGARVGNYAACALAGRAGTGDAEKSLLIANLAAAVAGTAGGWPLARGGTGTLALLTSFVAADHYFLPNAEESFLEFQRNVLAEIGTALNPAAASSATTEHVSKAEKFAENIAEILEHTGIESSALRSCAAQSRMTVAVIHRALFRVGQNGVSLADFLEFLLRIRIVGISVRVVLQRKLTVRALEFDLTHRAGDTQNVVIVSFCVSRQKWPFLIQTTVLVGRNKCVIVHRLLEDVKPVLALVPGFRSCHSGRSGYEFSPRRVFAVPYFPGFLATFTIAGRSKRSLHL